MGIILIVCFFLFGCLFKWTAEFVNTYNCGSRNFLSLILLFFMRHQYWIFQTHLLQNTKYSCSKSCNRGDTILCSWLAPANKRKLGQQQILYFKISYITMCTPWFWDFPPALKCTHDGLEVHIQNYKICNFRFCIYSCLSIFWLNPTPLQCVKKMGHVWHILQMFLESHF